MRGLGVGILFSTIILSISFHASSKTNITDKEIMKRAEQLGMEKTDKSDLNLDDLLKTTLSPTIAPTISPSIEPTVEPTTLPTTSPIIEPSISPTIEPTTSPTSPPAKTASDEDSTIDETLAEVKYVTLEVKKGMSSEKVASLLKESGVIKDDKIFNQYLIKKGYARIIKMGEYQIATGASFEQIVNIIIGN